MAVNAQHGPADVGRVTDNVANQIGEFFRYGIADRVGEIDGGGAGGNSGLENATQEITVTAGAVLGRKFDVVRERLRIFDRVNGPLENCIARHLQLVFEMNVGCGDEGVDAGFSGMANGLPGTIDIAS